MRQDLKNVKLILLGLITTAIPVLFIFQAENIDKKSSELVNLKKTNDSLVSSNRYKDSLISFQKFNGRERLIDTSRVKINFNPKIDIPKSVDYTKSLDAINQTLKDINGDIKKSYAQNQKGATDSFDIYRMRIDSLRQIISQRNKITRESLINSEIIENKILRLCQSPKSNRREISELLTQFDSLCREIDNINSKSKWKNILGQ